MMYETAAKSRIDTAFHGAKSVTSSKILRDIKTKRRAGAAIPPPKVRYNMKQYEKLKKNMKKTFFYSEEFPKKIEDEDLKVGDEVPLSIDEAMTRNALFMTRRMQRALEFAKCRKIFVMYKVGYGILTYGDFVSRGGEILWKEDRRITLCATVYEGDTSYDCPVFIVIERGGDLKIAYLSPSPLKNGSCQLVLLKCREMKRGDAQNGRND